MIRMCCSNGPIPLMKHLVVFFMTSMSIDKVTFMLLEVFVNSFYSRLFLLLFGLFHLSSFFEQTFLFLDLCLNSKHFSCSLCNRCLSFFIRINHAFYVSSRLSGRTNCPLGTLARSRCLPCHTISFIEDRCGIHLMRISSLRHFL